MSVAILNRPVYSVADAGDILRVPQSTLRWWLEGRSDDRHTYPPVLRPEPTGDTSLTWGEFVEAALLRQYRRDLRVPLEELRRFIGRLRDKEGVPYPLAHHKPWVGSGHRLLVETQEESGLPDELWLVAYTSGQLLLTPPADSFVKRVEWADDFAVAWRPHEDERSPVRCSPTHRFGHPSIKGISTATIVEHLNGGEDEEDVAEQFDLADDDVAWARSYELSSRTAPRAA